MGTLAIGDLREPRPTQSQLGRSAEAWIFRALLFVVALAPLPLGSNRPLPAAIMALTTGVLLAIWGMLASLTIIQVRIEISRIAWPATLYALACLWIIIQWVPVGVNPVADPIWEETTRFLGAELPRRISVNPEATITGLTHLLTYAAIFWLALQLARDADRARQGINAVALIGSTYAVYGLVVYLSGNEWILIYRKWTYLNSLTSTFVNGNSFATFAGLCLLCAVHLLFARTRHLLGLNRTARIKVVMLVEELTVRSRWITIAVLTLSIALILTGSRAGAAATIVGLICQLALYLVRRRSDKSQTRLAVALIVTIAGIAFISSGNRLAERMSEHAVVTSLEVRTDIYRQTIDAIRVTPWTGTGFGTFSDVFTAYRNDNQPLVVWDKAHNTYLENALELGVPAALALFLSIVLLSLRAANGIRERRREKTLPAIGFAASVVVGLHSLLDFSLQIPAVSILFAFLLGISVSQSWRTSVPRT